MSADIPAGFAPIHFDIPFFELIGPVYHLVDAPVLHLGMRVEHRHCNSADVVHGGLLATLADIAIARALVQHRDENQRAFTLSLHLDFIGSAALGSWIEAHIDIKKDSGSIGFASCEVRDGERVLLNASGAFKFITKRN